MSVNDGSAMVAGVYVVGKEAVEYLGLDERELELWC